MKLEIGIFVFGVNEEILKVRERTREKKERERERERGEGTIAFFGWGLLGPALCALFCFRGSDVSPCLFQARCFCFELVIPTETETSDAVMARNFEILEGFRSDCRGSMTLL